jgi:hypothetical protein
MSLREGVNDAKTSNPLHQISNANLKSICDGLNCEQCRILDATLNAAKESAVNVGFGGEGFLSHLSLQPHFPNPLAKLFRNVMPHSQQCYLGTTVLAVGYTQQRA